MKNASTLPQKIQEKVLLAQKSEHTEYLVYKTLIPLQKNEKNKKILEHIAQEELGHADFWKKYTQKEVFPDRFKIWWFPLVARIFGLTFGLRLMEKSEINAQINYEEIIEHIPEGKYIIEDEKRHEQELIELLEEKKLKYVGSVVLGLNDALVELTGALAGLSFAFQNTSLIAITGMITGISASLSMASSEYLSQKSDNNSHPKTSALYTGIAYIFTVFLLVAPFFVLDYYLTALGVSLFLSVLIILVFNFYLSVAKNIKFWPRFLEMAGISLGVSAFSFCIGVLVRLYLGVDV